MLQSEIVSRVSNQLRMVTKDQYISKRFVLYTLKSIALKLITQKIQTRTIARDMSLYKEVKCIEFKPVDIHTCEHVEFKSCDKLSKSVKKIKDLVYTRYGASIKELYSIDRKNRFTQSNLYQLRLEDERQNDFEKEDYFYIIDDYIYIPDDIKVLSGLLLTTDLYELESLNSCAQTQCKSAWDYDFVCPDSVIEDVIMYTVQQLTLTKQLPENPTANLNEQS